jgi:hypothetical protein
MQYFVNMKVIVKTKDKIYLLETKADKDLYDPALLLS